MFREGFRIFLCLQFNFNIPSSNPLASSLTSNPIFRRFWTSRNELHAWALIGCLVCRYVHSDGEKDSTDSQQNHCELFIHTFESGYTSGCISSLIPKRRVSHVQSFKQAIQDTNWDRQRTRSRKTSSHSQSFRFLSDSFLMGGLDLLKNRKIQNRGFSDSENAKPR